MKKTVREVPLRDDIFHHDEESEEWFPRMLSEFEEKFWPYYKARGYSKDTALLHFAIDDMREQVTHIKNLLLNPDEATE